MTPCDRAARTVTRCGGVQTGTSVHRDSLHGEPRKVSGDGLGRCLESPSELCMEWITTAPSSIQPPEIPAVPATNGVRTEYHASVTARRTRRRRGPRRQRSSSHIVTTAPPGQTGANAIVQVLRETSIRQTLGGSVVDRLQGVPIRILSAVSDGRLTPELQRQAGSDLHNVRAPYRAAGAVTAKHVGSETFGVTRVASRP